MFNVLRSVGLFLGLVALTGCPEKEVDTGSDYAYVVVIPTDNSYGALLRAEFVAKNGDSRDQIQFTQETGLSDETSTLEVEPGTVWVSSTAVLEFGEDHGEDDGTSANVALAEQLDSCEMEAGEVNTVIASIKCDSDATEVSQCNWDFYFSADPSHDRDSGCATLSSTGDADDASDDSTGGAGGGFTFGRPTSGGPFGG